MITICNNVVSNASHHVQARYRVIAHQVAAPPRSPEPDRDINKTLQEQIQLKLLRQMITSSWSKSSSFFYSMEAGRCQDCKVIASMANEYV